MAVDSTQYFASSPLSAACLAQYTAVLARSFPKDPLFVRLQPSDLRRERGLTALFSAVLRDAARRGGVLLMPNAALTWLPVRKLHANLLTQLLRGYGRIPIDLGWKATWDLQAHEEWCGRRILNHGSSEAAYIWAVGVEPAAAGQGLGTKLVRDALSRISATHRICVLRTEQPKNLRFYEKLGFRCVEQVTSPHVDIPSWFFVRELEGS